MSSDQVFVVSNSTATRAESVKMAGSELLERHLQQWIKQHPDLLGEELLVVTEEFDRWVTASGERTADRLDVLALDSSGGLVVAELKRHQAPNTVLVQALNYAAMVSRFTVEDLVDAHARFLDKEGYAPADGEDPREHARGRLEAWAGELTDARFTTPRIVLVAEDFGSVLTSTSVFLIESGLDLRLVQIGLHRLVDGTLALTTSQVLPVPLAEDFMIRPGVQPPRHQATGSSSRPTARLRRLISSGVLSDGEALTVVVPSGLQPEKVDSEAVETWLAADPRRRSVRWRNDIENPLLWEYENSTWEPVRLAREIARRATGVERADVWGFAWLQVGDGRTLGSILRKLARSEE